MLHSTEYSFQMADIYHGIAFESRNAAEGSLRTFTIMQYKVINQKLSHDYYGNHQACCVASSADA